MRNILLLMAICGLATALPQKRSVESEFEDAKSRQICTANTKKQHIIESQTFTVTAPPTYTGIIAIMDAQDLVTKVTEAGDKLVVIFVMNEWCYYSRKVVPTVEDIAAMKDRNNTNKVVVLKVVSDMMDNEDVNWKFGVNEVARWPTFIFVKDGVKLEQFIGANSARLRRTVTRLTTRLNSEGNNEIDGHQ